jgi:hypothetical protein
MSMSCQHPRLALLEQPIRQGASPNAMSCIAVSSPAASCLIVLLAFHRIVPENETRSQHQHQHQYQLCLPSPSRVQCMQAPPLSSIVAASLLGAACHC